MELDTGRRVVNWKTADWCPYPALDGDKTGLRWNPIRAGTGDGDGFYLMKIAPGGGGKLHEHTALETFVILQGELIDVDGRVLKEGDCIVYQPGTRHSTHSPTGCIMLVWVAGPLVTIEGNDGIAEDSAGRKVLNWHEADFTLYPSLPPTADPIHWHDICGNAETGEGFYLVTFPPGATSAYHEHMGFEHFAVLQGELQDSDGVIYRAGDCVSLEPGTRHASCAPIGCVTVVFIEAPLRALAAA